MNERILDVFARNYAKEGMLAYVAGIQRQERANGVETLQHQTWSGANYYDALSKYLNTFMVAFSL